MDEFPHSQTSFPPTTIEIKQVESFILNDDETDDGQSSTDTVIATKEIRKILADNSSQPLTSLNLPNFSDDPPSLEKSSSLVLSEILPVPIPRSVYHYAAKLHETFESPRQNKLEHDVTTILGTSDPPPGFGFLHPRYYSLEQKRPTPMKPLQVWRGYNGNVYFTPIHVQRIDCETSLSPPSSYIPTLKKVDSIENLNTILSTSREEKKQKKKTIKGLTSSNEELLERRRTKIHTRTTKTTTTTTRKTKTNEIKTPNSLPSIDHLTDKPNEMWQSVVTCAPIRIKAISKRSQNAIDDLHALQQEQSLLDPTGYNRQVLPNIRPVPKSKFIYKGLAYKESQRLPGINQSQTIDNDDNALQKPLIAYNLAQAYARYEIDAARAKQSGRPPPPPSAATGMISKDFSSQSHLQTSLDMRERRKRIVKGTTLSYRPPTQSMIWTPGRSDQRSAVPSESAIHHRPSTSKSSIPQKQTTVVNMPILTKYVNPTESSSRHTQLSDMITGV